MPKEAFFALDPEKQEHILSVASEEFAEHGYQNASTNRIVRTLQISKGSLFYYFQDKADLYLYLIEQSTRDYMEVLRSLMSDQPPEDILERLRLLTNAALRYLQDNPAMFRLMMTFTDSGTADLLERFMQSYATESLQEFRGWFADINTENLAFDRDTTLQLITWLFAGIKIELLYRAGSPRDEQEFSREFMKRLDVVLSALARAIYREPEDMND